MRPESKLCLRYRVVLCGVLFAVSVVSQSQISESPEQYISRLVREANGQQHRTGGAPVLHAFIRSRHLPQSKETSFLAATAHYTETQRSRAGAAGMGHDDGFHDGTGPINEADVGAATELIFIDQPSARTFFQGS
ncbi:MAG TPA: hypothetical protein VE783_11360 [Candidatus Limnocylindrales bacterium]|nr:hypothetical protein [Candidatus Limnocylindrales bacterium]